jgi:hypothetical protein
VTAKDDDRRARLELAERVGHQLVRLGLHKHAHRLREYYATVRAGRPLRRDGWGDELVVEWARTLRIPPHENDYPVRTWAERCGCLMPRTFTQLTFPGGHVSHCAACKLTWITLDEAVP